MDRNKAERVHDDPALWRMAEPDRHVVIVAHGGTNAVVIGYLLGIQPVPWEWERFVSYHASASTLHPDRRQRPPRLQPGPLLGRGPSGARAAHAVAG